MPHISLLLASFMNRTGSQDHLLRWLDAAAEPAQIEGIVAGDSNDSLLTRAISPQHGGNFFTTIVSSGTKSESTSVRNWNAAAALATGRLLFTISDDLFPPSRWDASLLSLVESLDPLRRSFAIKIGDFPGDTGTLLRHPVVSRAYFRKHRLFDAAYTGVFCDTDLSRRAFQKAAVFDGRKIVFDHRHPLHDPSVAKSKSQKRQYANEAMAKGESIYRSKWPLVSRLSPVLLLRPPRRCWAQAFLPARVFAIRAKSLLVGCARLMQLSRGFVHRLLEVRAGKTGR